jgi:hypothetical protein
VFAASRPPQKNLKAAEQEGPDVHLERAFWQALQPLWNPAHVVCVDETSLNTAMARLSGWGGRGLRVLDRLPQSQWETTTLVLAMRQSGVLAPMVSAGAMNGALFLASRSTRSPGCARRSKREESHSNRCPLSSGLQSH